ncbi:MAG: adenosylhomocysteinase, partial [Candidatus Hadarchaeota archaeon]
SLGHPMEIMDMSFALQAMSAVYLAQNRGKLKPKVYEVPVNVDRRVAELKLQSMGVRLEKQTPEQRKYLESWLEGT